MQKVNRISMLWKTVIEMRKNGKSHYNYTSQKVPEVVSLTFLCRKHQCFAQCHKWTYRYFHLKGNFYADK